MARISKREAIKEIEKALDRATETLDSLAKGRHNPITNEIYHRTCGVAEAYLNVLDILKLNTFVTIRCDDI